MLLKLDTNTLTGLMILSLPMSIKLFFPSINTEFIFPAEFLIGILVILFSYNLLFRRQKVDFFDKSFLMHPLTILVFLYLIINSLSTVFSTMPLVSLKATIVKYCYIITFYFAVHTWIKLSFDSYLEMLKIYATSLAFVTIYALANHLQLGLNRNNAGFVSYPFFNDHTMYGAALAFLIPSLLSFSFFSKVFQFNYFQRVSFFLIMILFVLGFYFSFCRAAWISLFMGMILLLLILAGLRFKGFIFLLGILLVIMFFNRGGLINSFKENKIDSNVSNAGIYEQIFSLTNISNDVSNLERLNRWSCATRMFFDKPWFGFGPGTYQFQYSNYQRKEEMTYISTNPIRKNEKLSHSWSAVVGGLSSQPGFAIRTEGGGTAHSEYFLALSETGIFSILIFIAFFFVALYVALRGFTKSQNKKIKIMIMVALLGLTTYFVHGLFNNFLDDSSLAFLFWSSLSVLTTIDASFFHQSGKDFK